MNLGDRLKEARKHFGLNQIDFSNSIGMKQGSYSDVERGRNKGLSNSTIENIAKNYKSLNIDWLLTGEGEMLKNENLSKDDINSTNNNGAYERVYSLKNFMGDYYSYLDYNKIDKYLLDKQISQLIEKDIKEVADLMGLDQADLELGIDIVSKSPSTGKLVPIYNAMAAAGGGAVELSNSREGWINVGDLLKDSEGSIYVYGNSMIPGYPPGSLIGIRPLNESFIEPGSVYVVQTESNRYIKRLYYNDDNTALVCLSDNHIKHTDGPMEGKYLYPPFEIPFSAVVIIYKVTGVIKRNSIAFS